MGDIHSDFKILRLIVVRVEEFISTKVIKCANSRTATIMIKKKSRVKVPQHILLRCTQS